MFRLARTLKDMIPPEWLGACGALLATAVGTLAGVLANSGFGLGGSGSDLFFGLLGPLFDRLGASPTGQLVFAAVIHRVPVVLMIGLLVGLILRGIRFPWLLLGSVPVWPADLLAREFLRQAAGADPAHGGVVALLRSSIVPEALAYLMQYSLLLLVIGATHAVAGRRARAPA